MNDFTSIKKSIFTNTCGLVVIGGNSSRMGTDKSLLQYYAKPQRYHVYDMLGPLCEKIFISCNSLQAGTIDVSYSFLPDKPEYNNIGPMAALLSAFDEFPNRNMLMIGCDYPFLTSDDLQQFLVCCKEENKAVSFYNETENMYEPLLAWYPYSSMIELKKIHTTNQYSLQQFLRNTGAVKFYPHNKNSIISVDTNEDFINASNLIK